MLHIFLSSWVNMQHFVTGSASLPWQRRLCSQTPAQSWGAWSHSLCWSWRNDGSNSWPAQICWPTENTVRHLTLKDLLIVFLCPRSQNISTEKKVLTPSCDAAMLKCSDLLTSLVSKLFSVFASGNKRSDNNNTLCSRSHIEWNVPEHIYLSTTLLRSLYLSTSILCR